MITTKQINVNLTKGKLKLRHVTTKNIDAGIRVEPPKVPIKTKSITTTTQADVADIAEKKRRDDIMVEKKLAMKDEKKIVMVEKEDDGELLQRVEHEASRNGYSLIGINVEAGKTMESEKEEKKPWNKMNAKERKEYQAEKARKKK